MLLLIVCLLFAFEIPLQQALERKKRRGQGPPKKGEGKRQKKRR
jgi:hypothetical protein